MEWDSALLAAAKVQKTENLLTHSNLQHCLHHNTIAIVALPVQSNALKACITNVKACRLEDHCCKPVTRLTTKYSRRCLSS
jgi:hypothetical protein